MIKTVLSTLFGSNRNAVAEVAELFRVNAEAADQRGHDLDSAAMQQFAAEFVARAQRTWWDSLIDGLNRLPRPLFVMGVFWILTWSAVDPVYMGTVFASWAIIPAPVWMVIAAIVTFFFGGRAQIKDQDFQRDLAGMVARSQSVVSQRAELSALSDPSPAADDEAQPVPETTNPALAEWRAQSNK